MYKNNFKNGGFPPLKYCDVKVIKQPPKERFYAKPLSKNNIQSNILLEPIEAINDL
jgi:hypothetical protein